MNCTPYFIHFPLLLIAMESAIQSGESIFNILVAAGWLVKVCPFCRALFLSPIPVFPPLAI